MDARIVTGRTVYGAFNYTDSEIKKNSSRPYTVGNKSPYTPDYTINLGSQMEAPLSDKLSLLFKADYRITGPAWFHTVQDQSRPTLFSGLIPISALNTLPASFGNANYVLAGRKGRRAQPAARAGGQELEGERLCQQLSRREISERGDPRDRIRRIVHLTGDRRSYGLGLGYNF